MDRQPAPVYRSPGYCRTVPQIDGADNLVLRSGKHVLIDLMSGTSCAGMGQRGGFNQWTSSYVMKLPRCTYDYDTLWRDQACELLGRLLPGYEFAFFSGGAECVEAAIRVAQAVTGRKAIVGVEGCFHGKTYLTGLLSSETRSELTDFLSYDDPYRDINEHAAAFIFEPFQTRNGVSVPPAGWLEESIAGARRSGALVIDDEISTSIRCGRVLALADSARLQPELICLGKNWGQGFPVTVLCIREDIAQHQPKVSLTSGYGSNPMACMSVAYVASRLLETRVLSQVRSTGYAFLKDLERLVGPLARVTGQGMWFGVSTGEYTARVAEALLAEHYIVGVCPTSLRLAPPFELKLPDWQAFCEALRSALSTVRVAVG